jgi:hypothetical protein
MAASHDGARNNSNREAGPFDEAAKQAPYVAESRSATLCAERPLPGRNLIAIQAVSGRVTPDSLSRCRGGALCRARGSNPEPVSAIRVSDLPWLTA